MKLSKYIDSKYDKLACQHTQIVMGSNDSGVVDADGNFFVFHQALFDGFDFLREEYGNPIAITSGFRCKICQKELKIRYGNRAADVSEHEYNAAYDLRPWHYRASPPATDHHYANWRRALQVEIRYMKSILEDSELRVGTALYDDTLLHLGAGFLLEPNPQPAIWTPKRRF